MTSAISPETFSWRRHGIAYVALGVWCALVWVLSSKSDPGDSVGFVIDLPDYVLHAIEYAAGGLVAARAFSHLRSPLSGTTALAFCVVYGVLDEWHQSFVPGRDASFSDVAADAVGALAGIALHALISRRRRD